MALTEIEVTLGKGVAGTLTVPPYDESESPHEEGLAPTTHKMSIIVHGQGGHRNYCYQRELAHRLARDLGIYLLRIDFRGCGNLADNEDDAKGRVLSQDIEDIEACADFVTDKSKNPLHKEFTLLLIVAHSRGGVAMFLWALEQDRKLRAGEPAYVVPNLVNCLARFQLPTVLDRYPVGDGLFGDVLVPSLRHGKIQYLKVTEQELVELSKPDLLVLSELSPEVAVLSVYGLKDTIIPIVDAGHYATTLNRGRLTHTLELVPDADHNFYGVEVIENALDAEEYNPLNLPLNKKNLVNYNPLVVNKIIDFLSPQKELDRFYHHSKHIGLVPRWRTIDGISNFRDVGGWRIAHPRYGAKGAYVRPEVMYRCADTANITERGKQQLQHLGIKVVFDLRSDGECDNNGVPQGLEAYGVTRIHAPVFSKDDYSPQAIALRYTNLMTSWNTYVHVYERMFEYGKESFRTILEYIRDDGRPFVFHCTAGKDRTGILGMVILLLVGVDNNSIAKEYELTTCGLRPDHPKLRANFIDTVNQIKEKMGDNSSAIEDLIVQGRKNWTIEHDGFNNLISSRYEAMLATIELFNDKYGDVLGYVKNELGFSDDDIVKIHNNLVTQLDEGYTPVTSVLWQHRSKF